MLALMIMGSTESTSRKPRAESRRRLRWRDGVAKSRLIPRNGKSYFGDGKLERVWQHPDKLRVEIAYPSHIEVRDVDGDRGTQNRMKATGVALDAMRLQAARLAIPILLVEKKSELKTAGPNSIEIPVSGDLTVTIDVDPATGHILKSTGKAVGVDFSTTYSDFRNVDGLLFAFREANTAQGTATGTNEISKVEISLRK